MLVQERDHDVLAEPFACVRAPVERAERFRFAVGLPVVVLPYLNAAQAGHPALGEGIERLRRLGVRVLFGPDVLALHRPRQGKRDQFPWHLTLPALKETAAHQPREPLGPLQ